MSNSVTKISVEELSRDRSFHVLRNGTAVFRFTHINANDNNVERRYETSAATLFFVRGTGKIAINGGLVEYGQKWFEIPGFVEYQIFPETDTVMLTIAAPPQNYK